MKLNKTQTMWVVVNGVGDIYYNTLSYTRKYSIEVIERFSAHTWEYFKEEYGYSCIKVLVTISRKEEVK